MAISALIVLNWVGPLGTAPCHHGADPGGCTSKLPPILDEFPLGNDLYVGPLVTVEGTIDATGAVKAAPGARGSVWFSVHANPLSNETSVDVAIVLAGNASAASWSGARNASFTFDLSSGAPHVEVFEFTVARTAMDGPVDVWYTVSSGPDSATRHVGFTVSRPATSGGGNGGDDGGSIDPATALFIAIGVAALAGVAWVLGSRNRGPPPPR